MRIRSNLQSSAGLPAGLRPNRPGIVHTPDLCGALCSAVLNLQSTWSSRVVWHGFDPEGCRCLQVCSYQCIVSNETEKLEDFTLCVLQVMPR